MIKGDGQEKALFSTWCLVVEGPWKRRPQVCFARQQEDCRWAGLQKVAELPPYSSAAAPGGAPWPLASRPVLAAAHSSSHIKDLHLHSDDSMTKKGISEKGISLLHCIQKKSPSFNLGQIFRI